MQNQNVIWFKDLRRGDVGLVGGKNSSLGEMYSNLTKLGVKVPNGFATTAQAYKRFLRQNNLQSTISELLDNLDINDVEALEEVGATIRKRIIAASFADDFKQEIIAAYELLVGEQDLSVAVRSSATAEDLPEASFAGQQETYLNVSGIDNLLLAIKSVFASLYNDRAIAYRVHNNFAHEKVALSVGIQLMVRSDKAVSGVMFTLDTESGFDKVVFINGAYGLGETVVQGSVNPDEFYIYKPNLERDKFAVLRKSIGDKAIKMIYTDNKEFSKGLTETIATTKEEQNTFVLNDSELHELAKFGVIIEKHYGMPLDIEWAKDGISGELYIVQARPETVKSRVNKQIIRKYELKEEGKKIVEGHSIGQLIGEGKARVLESVEEIERVQEGDVLVTDMTDPDWEPIMKKAAAIITNRGGRTCHAAIVARELGIPAVVGCEGATELIKDGQDVTVCCAEGDIGYVYDGFVKYDYRDIAVNEMPELPVKIMLNLANPEQAFNFSFIPNNGVGLARLEFIINNTIGVHPNAVLNYDKLDNDLKAQISKKVAGYKDPVDFYVCRLREGMATIAAAFYPQPVIFRTSDFKTNEYVKLLGGEAYEAHEENPMIGFRGASRYVHAAFKDAFGLECKAIKELRENMGFTNVEVMIPFVRTVNEIKNVLKVLEHNGLKRGENGLRVIMMCEVPSNAILAEEFLQHVDGFSIGSNDLTQLTLGLDRDSEIVADLFDERNDAVKFFLSRVIEICNRLDKYIGICGQAPSDYPDLADWLVKQGIKTISLNPDSVIDTWLYIARHHTNMS